MLERGRERRRRKGEVEAGAIRRRAVRENFNCVPGARSSRNSCLWAKNSDDLFDSICRPLKEPVFETVCHAFNSTS